LRYCVWISSERLKEVTENIRYVIGVRMEIRTWDLLNKKPEMLLLQPIFFFLG